ncbi:MAG: hypothetical protein ACAH95_16150 [Fimbriimonas sp.]
MQISKNGAVLMSSDTNAVRVWNIATRKIICALGLTSVSRTLAHDGSGLYFANGDRSRIYFYNFSTRVTSSVKTDGVQYGPAYNLALSSDGTKIAFSTWNSTTSRINITTATIATGSTIDRWALAASTDCYQVAWVNGDARILVGQISGTGLRLFTATGTLLATKSAAIYQFTVHPNSNVVYTRDTAGNLLALDTTGNLTQLWLSASSTADYEMKVSSDGLSLLSTGLSDDNTMYAVRQFSTVDGTRLAGSMNVSPVYGAVYLTSDPSSNSVIFSNYAGGSHIERWTFNSSTGSGTRQTDVDQGDQYTAIQTFGTAANPYFSTLDPVFGGNRIMNAKTGAAIRHLAKSPVVYSPTGTYYAWIGSRESDNAYGLHIYRNSDDTRVASYNSVEAQYCGWTSTTDSHVWLTKSDGHVRTMSFSGSALTLIKDWVGPSGDAVRMNTTGSRTAHLTTSQLITVYDTPSGVATGTIDLSSTATGAIDWGFAGDTIYVFAWTANPDSSYTAEIRYYNVSATPVLTGTTTTYSIPAAPYTWGHARVSDDLTVAVIVRSLAAGVNGMLGNDFRVFRVADGAQLKKYDNQFTDWNYSDLEISKDNTRFTTIGDNTRVMTGNELQPVIRSISLNPIQVVGGNSSTATVTINRAAPAGGVVIAVTGEGASVPATVTILEGNTSVDFQVGTDGVDTTITKWITATFEGLAKTAPLEIIPPSVIGIAMNPTSVNAGVSSTGTITLNGKAGPSGYVVNLSSDKAYVTVPGSATVTSGNTSVQFTANTSEPGSTGTATITGTHNLVTGTATLQVTTSSATVQFLEASIKGGNALTLKITLQNPAPVGGTAFNLTGDALSTPVAQVTVPAGATTYEVGVNTNATLTDASTTVTVTPAAGGGDKTATATVLAPIFKSLNAGQLVVAGAKTTKLLILLDAIAPAGLTYAVSSSSASITVPASVTVPAGAFFATIDLTVKKSTTSKNVKITVGPKIITIILKPNP